MELNQVSPSLKVLRKQIVPEHSKVDKGAAQVLHQHFRLASDNLCHVLGLVRDLLQEQSQKEVLHLIVAESAETLVVRFRVEVKLSEELHATLIPICSV